MRWSNPFGGSSVKVSDKRKPTDAVIALRAWTQCSDVNFMKGIAEGAYEASAGK